MSFHRWLHHLRPALAPRRGQRRPPAHRLSLEVLEDRLTFSLTSAGEFPVGANPQAMVAGDFNNDSYLDLAVGNCDDGTLGVLLGDGQGGLGAARQFAVGENIRSLAVADFDNDGNLDLAWVNNYYQFGYTNVSVMLGNGDGTFRAPTYPRTEWGPLTLAVGDFNGDGKTDLAVSEDDYNSFGYFEALLGDGRGGFTQAPGQQNSYPTAGGLTVADLDRDGTLDVITLNGGRGGFALLGNGAGSFSGYDQRDYYVDAASVVAVGDFTGDGVPDAVSAGAGAVFVLLGRGDGRFDPPMGATPSGNQETSVAAADFNGDGKLDAVTSEVDTGTVGLVLGNGDGTLNYAGALAVGSSPSAVVVGDFNGDGRPDVAAANAGSNTVSMLLNNGTWSPPPSPPPACRISDVTVTEGNTGTVAATFTVTLSAASTQPITVAYATADGTTTAGSDYQAASGSLTFAPGETSKSITMAVNGDRLPEPNETFVVNLSSPTNATIADGQGVGKIIDDEPRISISDVTKAEGKKGQTTLFIFSVTLSAAYDQPVTMSYRTADGTAKTSDQDFVAKTGTLTFAPGETTKTITIEVKGDSKKEAHESFFADLYNNSVNSLFTKNRGLGTILNDD